MREEDIRAKIAEIDQRIEDLKRKLAQGEPYALETTPATMAKKTEYDALVPKNLRVKRFMTLDEIMDNMSETSDYVEYANRLEEGKASVELYHTLRKTKGTHPTKFNEPEYVEIRKKFDQLHPNMKKHLAPEMDQLAKIAMSSDFSPIVFDHAIDRALKKLEEEPENIMVIEPFELLPVHEELKREWLSEGIIRKRFLEGLQARHPEEDIGRELIDFYTKKKLSAHMVEYFPAPKKLKTARHRQAKAKRRN
jgi:hypothetical protein